MKWRTGLILILVGITALAGWLPGTDAMAIGPRIGMGLLFLTFGLLIYAVPATTWILAKTTKPADYKGSCPAGEPCGACGAFNLKPRTTCRSCGGAVNQVEAEAL